MSGDFHVKDMFKVKQFLLLYHQNPEYPEYESVKEMLKFFCFILHVYVFESTFIVLCEADTFNCKRLSLLLVFSVYST